MKLHSSDNSHLRERSHQVAYFLKYPCLWDEPYDAAMRREVALKIPLPGQLVDPNARSRFLREARAAGLLNHPNIITIYVTGESGAFCYVASEYYPA